MTVAFPERAVELAIEAAREIGLDPAGASILRVASAVTVELPRAGVVARVEVPTQLTCARRQVVVARLLAERAVPAALLVAPECQPVARRDGVITLWRRLRIVGRDPAPEVLGRLVRQLHDAFADDLPTDIPAFDPFEPIPDWLNRPVDRPLPPGVDRLWWWLEQLRAGWDEAARGDPLGTVLVHGDLHADNVVLTKEGPTLLDLELAGRGPASWDLLAQLLAVRRYGRPTSDYRRFCAAYGCELPDWRGLKLLQQAYELHLVAWAVGHRDVSPAMAEQAALRLAGFLGHDDEPWTLI